MSADTIFTKDNLDMCLRKIAKEFRKFNVIKTPSEIILIGGASALTNNNFRDSTYDIEI